MSTSNQGRRRFRRTGIATVIGGIVVSVVGLVGTPATASVNDPTPDPYSKNKTCQTMGYDYEYKLEPQGIPAAGNYTVPASDDVPGGATITISNVESPNGRVEFDWSSTTTWDAVMVKQADGGLIYRYDPAVTSDQNVQTVSGQNQGGISHVNFCRGGDGIPQCEPGQTGTYPDCVDPECEPGQTGTYPDCVDPECEPGQTGTYPDCVDPECEPGQTGTFPNCVDPQCEPGQTGTFPDCVDPQCEPGQTGTFPNCEDPETPCAFNAALSADDPACVEPTSSPTPPAPQVEGAVVTNTPAPAPAPVQVAGTQAAALPRTGSTTVPLVQLGLGLILMGAGAVLFGREGDLAV